MKNKRLEIRVSETEKNKIDLVLDDINKNSRNKKGYRFLIMEFVNNYLENNLIGLEYQKQQLIKENKKIENEKNKLIGAIQENNIKIQKIDNELNHKTIYDISNYNYNTSLINAFNRLKEITLNNNIKDVSLLDNDIRKLENTFKIKDKDLLKNVVLNHFQEWQKELLLMDPEPEPDKKEIIQKITNIILRRYKDNRNQTKDIDKFLNQKQIKQVIKSFIENNNSYDLNENEIKTNIKNNIKI